MDMPHPAASGRCNARLGDEIAGNVCLSGMPEAAGKIETAQNAGAETAMQSSTERSRAQCSDQRLSCPVIGSTTRANANNAAIAIGDAIRKVTSIFHLVTKRYDECKRIDRAFASGKTPQKRLTQMHDLQNVPYFKA